jgi:lysophospholipase L1-like esterase
MSLLHDQIAFHNVAELESVPGLGGLRLQRFPAAVRDTLGFKPHSRGRFFAHRASGCELRFVAAGPFVRVTLSAQESDATVIVYKGDHAHSQHRLAAGVVTSLFLEEPAWFAQVDPAALGAHRFAPNVWRLAFNQDAVVGYHHVDTFGHALRPPTPGETPARTWLAYGSSITFGANTLHSPNAYVQHAAHLLGVDVLNKGLPGSCLCEPQVAAWFAALADWDFATFELGVNLAELASPDEFADRARVLLETIHRARPERPVFVLNIFPNRADHLRDRSAAAAINTPLFNAIVPRLVAEINHPNVRFIDGREILSGYADLHTDLVHPSDEGHLAMGRALARHLADAGVSSASK